MPLQDVTPVTYNGRMARPLHCIPTGSSPPSPECAPSRARSMRTCATCRSSARTATPIRPGSPTTQPFADAADLLLAPDHYLYRMLYSQGVAARARSACRAARRRDRRPIRARPGGCSPAHYHLFRGTPSALWLDHVFAEVFGLDVAPRGRDRRPLLRPHRRRAGDAAPSARARCSSASTSRCWPPPRVPTDTLAAPRGDPRSGWQGRVITAYRPDPVDRPRARGLPRQRSPRFGELTGEDVALLARLPRGAPQAPRRLPRRWAPPRPITATRPRAPPTSPQREARGAVRHASSPGTLDAGRRRAVPRPDADRDGAR